eukprot:CAMPEP_0184323046 /NCGR_PEP_ID=MMETSP1049-20130417/128244_1 /TAXON_ID=77928 /ORGANISM="Proteomonas sulcata, Strain CCMP704" /LENGTH=88 /DNA_ID=CAMNT_0026644409 /DNA_START=145 /DNA_END=407 /DNA_ORIENTATION=-
MAGLVDMDAQDVADGRAARGEGRTDEDDQEMELTQVARLVGHESRVFSAEFCPVDDGLLATCSEDQTCRLWDVARQKQILLLRGHKDA